MAQLSDDSDEDYSPRDYRHSREGVRKRRPTGPFCAGEKLSLAKLETHPSELSNPGSYFPTEGYTVECNRVEVDYTEMKSKKNELWPASNTDAKNGKSSKHTDSNCLENSNKVDGSFTSISSCSEKMYPKKGSITDSTYSRVGFYRRDLLGEDEEGGHMSRKVKWLKQKEQLRKQNLEKSYRQERSLSPIRCVEHDNQTDISATPPAVETSSQKLLENPEKGDEPQNRTSSDTAAHTAIAPGEGLQQFTENSASMSDVSNSSPCETVPLRAADTCDTNPTCDIKTFRKFSNQLLSVKSKPTQCKEKKQVVEKQQNHMHEGQREGARQTVRHRPWDRTMKNRTVSDSNLQVSGFSLHNESRCVPFFSTNYAII